MSIGITTLSPNRYKTYTKIDIIHNENALNPIFLKISYARPPSHFLLGNNDNIFISKNAHMKIILAKLCIHLIEIQREIKPMIVNIIGAANKIPALSKFSIFLERSKCVLAPKVYGRKLTKIGSYDKNLANDICIHSCHAIDIKIVYYDKLLDICHHYYVHPQFHQKRKFTIEF